MARPHCGRCGNFRVGEPYDVTRDCRVCWMIANDRTYAAHFATDDADTAETVVKPARTLTTEVTHKVQGDPTGKTGPGSELAKLLKELGIDPGACSCSEHERAMNLMGVAGCREHFAEVVGWLTTAAFHASIFTWLRAGRNAVLTGLAFRLNPLNPIPGIVTEAIRRAAVVESLA